MASLIDRIGIIQHKPRGLQPYESLVHAVIHQQLSGKAADTILTRFLNRIGNGHFPNPAAILRTSPELFREVGLSRPKATYMRALAEAAIAGNVPTLEECNALTDDEIIARLIPIKGIGRWTVEMLLIFNLGRPDVLPVDDLGIRRGFKNMRHDDDLPAPKALAAHGIIWAPHRSLASLYLWRAAA